MATHDRRRSMMRAQACLPSSLRAVLAVWLTVSVALLLDLQPVAAQTAAQNRHLKSEAIINVRTHSLYAPYVESDLQNKFWDFGGDAIVDTNKHVRLTQDRPSQHGWLWSRLPLQTPNFEIQIEFKIDGSASRHHPYGDGMALWLTEERAQPGPIFGSKDYYTGVGIMFDTFANARHPYTFPRIILTNLNGVERYHIERDGAGQELAGCSLDIRRAPVATRARLTHVKDVFTELAIHYSEWDQWETCFKLGNLTFPENPYLGLTAATGDVSDNHDIISVTTSSIVYKQQTKKEIDELRIYHLGDNKAKAGRKSAGGWWSSGSAAADSGGHAYNGNAGPGLFSRTFFGMFSLLWMLLKLAAVVGVVGAGVYAFYMRKKKYDVSVKGLLSRERRVANDVC